MALSYAQQAQKIASNQWFCAGGVVFWLDVVFLQPPALTELNLGRISLSNYYGKINSYTEETKMNKLNEWNEAIIEEFRANEGKVGGQFADTPLLLLHTTRAQSGLPRINPMAYIVDGERLAVMAAKGGATTNPDWYYNIVANPEVSAEIGTDQFQARATIAAEPERNQQLYEKMATVNPGSAEYQRQTTRIIPVIVLTRMP
jgi:deazaflavin-dependent oxidoreductase (nitroreductase family)